MSHDKFPNEMRCPFQFYGRRVSNQKIPEERVVENTNRYNDINYRAGKNDNIQPSVIS